MIAVTPLERTMRNALGDAFVAACVAIMMSLSRGGMLALVAGVIIVGWRSSRVGFAILIAALLLSPLWAPDYVKERVMSSQVEVEGSDEVALDMAADLLKQQNNKASA